MKTDALRKSLSIIGKWRRFIFVEWKEFHEFKFFSRVLGNKLRAIKW